MKKPAKSNVRVAYHFLTLPIHHRVEVAQALGVPGAQEPDMEFEKRVFTHARDTNQLARLWAEIEARHTDPYPEPNPFEPAPK